MAEVRYCTTEDGVRIAYCLEGEGPPLVVCPPSVASFSLRHLVPTSWALFEQIGEGRKIVRYDMRGTGLSERQATDFSGPALVLDIDAVVRAAGLKRFALWAAVLGGPRAIAYTAQHPHHVTHLILADTYARVAEAFPYEAAKGLAELCRTNWKVATQTIAEMGTRQAMADPHKRQIYGEVALQIARAEEQSAEGRVLASMILEAYESWDVSHLLGQVRAKTLVLHHLDNVLFPVSAGRQLAADIASAVFVPLEGVFGNVGLDPEQTPAIVSAVKRFLGERGGRKAASAPPAPVRTVLITDIAGSTEMMQRLGDERGREVLREHERITRELLKANGGTEVKTMGDGFMASFGSVTKAVECAIALQRAFAERNQSVSAHPERAEGAVEGAPPQGAASGAPTPLEPLHIRIGLNAGEPIEEEGPDGRSDLFGATVILAARIAAQAEGGEVLASMAVRELCAGKGFLFADRGEHALRGFEDLVRMFEVHWRE